MNKFKNAWYSIKCENISKSVKRHSQPSFNIYQQDIFKFYFIL